MTSYPPPPPGQNPPPAAGPPVPPPFGAPPQQPYGAPAQQPYGAPAQQAYNAPPQQAYGAPAPPPYVPVPTQQVTVPVVAWLVPLAALLAIIGVFTPWFKAKGTATGNGQTIRHNFDALYSFKDGKIGLLAPILLVLIAIGVVGLLVGKTPARFSKGNDPVASAGKASLIIGGVSAICLVVAWFLVKSQYKFSEGGKTYGWDEYIKAFKDAGAKLELSKGPQIGYFLTAAAALLAIVAGILMILAARTSSSTPAAAGYPQSGGNSSAAPGGYPAAPAGYPQSGPPAPGGYPQGPPPPQH